MNPAPQTLTRSRWNTAAFFGVFADIAGTLAQFMPMKSIFILAADELPSFFPWFLIELGTTITALILVGIAAVLATLSAGSKKISERLVHAQGTLSKKGAGEEAPSKRPPLTFAEYQSEVVAFILLAGSAAVSLTFAGAVLSWLIVTGMILSLRIRRRPRRPPYHTATLEFQVEWRKFVSRSALWVTVGAALITLVLDFPALGVTGILLGAVLLQRFQKAIGDLGQRLIREKEAPTNYARRGEFLPAVVSATPLVAPLDFLASPSGKSLLVQSLRKMDMDPDNWRVIGQPNRNQVSLLAERSIGGEKFILRLFASDREDFRKRELEFRQLKTDFTPFKSVQAVEGTIAGLPGIVVRLPRGNPPLEVQEITPNQAIEWQIDWELSCLTTSEKRKMWRHQQMLSAVRPIPDPEVFLLPHLRILAEVNGPHLKASRQVLRIFQSLRERFLSGPSIYSLGSQVQHVNLLHLRDGTFEVLDVSGLEVSLLGIAWGESGHFKRYAEDARVSVGLTSALLSEAQFRSKLKACGAFAGARNLGAFAVKAQALLETAYQFENMKVPLH